MDLQRVEFNSVKIGDHAWVEISYSGNPLIRVIPRAVGVQIYDTAEMGGGILNITVHAWVFKSSRKALEDYFKDFPAQLGYQKATLSFEGTSLTNVSLVSISPTADYHNYARFTISFVRSV